ncbi:MAG: exodeoxyribonuclease VII large subunit [Ruminococcaceae bacterium]|nr:exodeoxyribonuclease VII large subunit [Oscillospiraceae bacterium]
MAVITVSQLNNYMKRYIDNNTHLAKLWVRGEISNYKKHYTGHIYMTLKDEGSAIKAVMFKGSAAAMRFEPENGMKVIACGRVSVFERDGQYQLYVESMTPDGMGELHVAYEQLKNRLEDEGLFDPAHKRPIPRYPRAIGVVTSPTGAAIRDVLNVLSRRYRLSDIYIYPAQVQGQGASDTVVRGIECLNREKKVDVIIVGRGGGSIEDLWAFNEENVARAIYASKIPVISAVGHETDFTIADFVADLRAPTPSAGAELAVPSADELRNMLSQSGARLHLLLARLYELKKQRLTFLIQNRAFADFPKRIDERREMMDVLLKDMVDAYNWQIDNGRHALENGAAKLQTLSPLAVLGRGYALVQKEGLPIKSITDTSIGENLEMVLRDGKLLCEVKGITEG